MVKTPSESDDVNLPSPDVFISYASEDRDRAKAIVSALEMHGYSVWWDKELRANEAFSPVIERHLDAARVVLVLWSSSSVRKNFVREEAVRGQAKLIPVLLEDVSIPLGFGQASHVDLRRWRGDELSLDLEPLMQNVASIVARPVREAKPPAWLVLRSVFTDLKTRIGLTAAILGFGAVWLVWGHRYWRSADLQWALALWLAICAGWVSLRGSHFGRSTRWRWSTYALIAFAVVGWALGVYVYYQPPTFGGERVGILVARFDADSRDNVTQHTWLSLLQNSKNGQSTSAVMRAALNPVNIDLLRRRIASGDEAKSLTRLTRALTVIWGPGEGQVGLTFADLPGLAKLETLALAPLGTVSLEVDPRSIQFLADPIVLFASAYGAFARSDGDTAQRILQKALTSLEREVADDVAGRAVTSTDFMRATTHLLLGNTYFLEGCGRGSADACVYAIDQYAAALEIFVDDDMPGNIFIEASNNLAVAESKLTDNFLSSKQTLHDAQVACRALAADQPIACAFVTYNQALAANAEQQYSVALELLARVCDDMRLNPEALGSISPFPAECRQQQAYTAAKLGEQTLASTESTRWFAQAAAHVSEALSLLPAAQNDDQRLKISITRGRIAVGQNDFALAVELLRPLVRADTETPPALVADIARDYPELDGPEIVMLYVTADACNKGARRETVVIPEELPREARRYFDRKMESCGVIKEG